MLKVNILKNWDYPDLLQQTPGNKGIWGDIEFSYNGDQPADYVVVLNHPAQDSIVACPPKHVWAVMQEPPTEYKKIIHRGDPSYARIYTSDPQLKGKRYFHSHPALPWHINRSYDFLKTVGVPQKLSDVSWVTSNLMDIKGHRERMAFLEFIRGKMEFDLFGRGFNQIEDKWQAIAPYRCSLAIENYSNPFYWSEKIADCFLAWTMPIYYGCTHITNYFPAEAMILIDIHRPDEALERIQEAVRSQRWHKNLDAICFAREQVLERYQFFPFIVEQIKQEKKSLFSKKAQPVFIPASPRTPRFFNEEIHDITGRSLNLAKRVHQKLRSLLNRLFNLVKRTYRKLKSIL